VNAAGKAVFAWQRFDGAHWRIQTRSRSAAGVLSAVQTLSSGGQDALNPMVAVDATGDAVFSWARFDGAHYRIQVRARSAAGVLSAVRTLSDAGQDVVVAQVAIDPDGDSVIAWQHFDGANYRIQAQARSAAGVLSAVQTLSSGGQDAIEPRLAVETDGDAVFTWGRSDGTNPRIQARARSTAGVLSPVQTLSDAGQEGRSSVVGVDADGDAVFTWMRFDGVHWRIQARARSAAGALSAVQTLSSSRDDAFSPTSPWTPQATRSPSGSSTIPSG
jgi:hypothetical protein